MAVHHRDGVHDPTHDLGVGVDVGSGDVAVGSDHGTNGKGVAPGESFEFAAREGGGVNAHASLGTAVGDVHHGALDRHVRRQRGDLIGVHALVETDPTLARTTRGVVLNAPAGVHLDVARVHSNWYRDFEDALGGDDPLDHAVVEPEEFARGLDE